MIIDDLQLDSSLGDRVFCLVDLDLSKVQYEKILEEKDKSNRKCKVEFILSNPCFEIWLLYYFTDYPKVENSSQKVKEQLKKIVPRYTENFDIVSECNLFDMHAVAINRAEKKNSIFDDSEESIEKNPYTEVQDLVVLLMNYNKNKI